MIFFAYRSTPAPGHRHTYYGTLWYGGNYGYGWSSTVTGDNAHDFFFYYGWITLSHKDTRGLGLLLRCLQE